AVIEKSTRDAGENLRGDTDQSVLDALVMEYSTLNSASLSTQNESVRQLKHDNK
ncbi:unnamed protein product, partial [Adineta ricciae]